ncbi:hypothetical protein [Lactobacillus xylocopicola]|uniref:Uncharacterized protein n=1 Tax=Lactobacillus xylocopicola TaxID=2976676 RepID=A0ABN6SKS2_9LACO|nr:hypothetical protein [Lactobacillus xylocopicola]BDR60975.1 hypothetical protein KIM322_12360 [Lactobacillus xylocopicola]
MNAKEANAIIDDLYDQKQNDYYIDFVPITFPNEDFAELADYLENHYKPDFANKIVFIAFTIMHYYESYVFLDNTAEEPIYPDLVNKDLRHMGLDELSKLIHKIIIENWSGLYIIFKNENQISTMRISDEYDTSFRNLSGNALALVKQLVRQQGIYLKN